MERKPQDGFSAFDFGALTRALSQAGTRRMCRRVAQRDRFETERCGPVQAPAITAPTMMAAITQRI